MNKRRHSARSCTWAVLACAALWACGSGPSGCESGPSGTGISTQGETPAHGGRPEPGADQGPPLEPLPMGKLDLTGYAYSLGPGREAFQRVLAADKAGDWAGVVEHGLAALAADPGHLEAHWHVALALARQKRYDRVAEHLSAAVAGDYMRWGKDSLSMDALRGFYDTSEGRRYRALAERYGERFRRGVVEGVLVVGRRGEPWYPRKNGNQSLNHRSEIYAYELATRRFLRISRTNASLAGFIRAPGGTELSFVSYRRVWLPSPAEDGAGAEPYIREVQIGTIDLDEVVMSRHEVILDDVAELWLGYETGPEAEHTLMARVRPPAQSTQAATRQFIIHTAAGQARPVDPDRNASARDATAGDVLRIGYDAAERLRVPIEGVMADWDDLGAAGSFRLERTRKTVTLAGGELAHGHTMSWSPAQGRLVFATLAEEPCAASAQQVTLYVVEAATGTLRALATGPEPLAPVWVDEQRLAYVDSTGRASVVRVMDVATGEEIARIEAEGGVATDRVVGRAPVRRCSDDEKEPSLVRPAVRGG